MAVDHLIFNTHKFYPDTQFIKDYIDVSLIGKSITYSRYKVGWWRGRSLNDFDDSEISWTKPYDVDDNIASTGEVLGIAISKNKTPYYTVWFNHTLDDGTGDAIYTMLVKAGDLIKQNLSGNGL